MEKENVDPAYKYIDDKIKLTKHELQKQITSINKSLLETKLFVADNEIERFRLFLLHWLQGHSPNHSDQTYLRVRDYIQRHAESAWERIKTSTDPIAVAKEFEKDCREYCKKNHLRAFMD